MFFMIRKKQLFRLQELAPENTKAAHHLRACFHLHSQMPSTLQQRVSLIPAYQDRSVALHALQGRFCQLCHSQPLQLIAKHRRDAAMTRCVQRRREEEAPRWPIFRPDLEADVTQQSGTVCAAALGGGFHGTAADCCIELLTSAKTSSVYLLWLWRLNSLKYKPH